MSLRRCRFHIRLCVYNAGLSVSTDSLQDYCGYERFNARCPVDHVINVRRALYGRMQPGRSITGDYGHVMGCYADVTAYVSDTCDYRQNCTLLVATMDSVAQPCAKDFKSYLQAYYVCIRGNYTVDTDHRSFELHGHYIRGQFSSDSVSYNSCQLHDRYYYRSI